MERIIAFIPTAFCLVEFIDQRVISGLTNQGLSPLIFPTDNYPEDRKLRVHAIAEVRNMIAEYSQHLPEKYVAMCDYDVVLNNMDTVEQMIKRHEADPKLGAVMLTYHDENSVKPASSDDPHIGMYFGLWKKEALKDFDATIIGKGCECPYAKKSLINANWGVEILEPLNNDRIKHIKIASHKRK